MHPKDYQKAAARTLLDGTTDLPLELTTKQVVLAWNALGLTGEAGEAADLIKKHVFHEHELDCEKLKKELGDTLWYLTAIATILEFDLSEIMEANIQKLFERYPHGYNAEDSKKRVDVK